MEIYDDMSCTQVREVIDQKRSVEKIEEIVFVRHIRTCADCRREIPAEVRASAIHSIIMTNE
jgi:hypothetical protein